MAEQGPGNFESMGKKMINYSPDNKAGGVRGPEPNEDNDSLNDYINRQVGREMETNMEMVTHPDNSYEFYDGLRTIQELQEDGNVPKEGQDRWSPSRIHTTVYFNAKNHGVPIEELKRKQRVVEVVDNKGKHVGYKPSKPKFVSYAISYKPVVTGQEIRGNYTRDVIDYEYDYGESEERTNRRIEISSAEKKGLTEYQTRLILGEHISIRTSLRFRDSLEEIVSVMHSGGVSYLKADHLKVFFNMPGVEELKNGIKLSDQDVQQINQEIERKNTEKISRENRPLTEEEKKTITESIKDKLVVEEFEKKHELGDQVEEAVFLNLIMLNSPNKTRMQEFLRRPGVIRLMARLADKDSSLHINTDGLPEEEKVKLKAKAWMLEHVGNVDGWEEDKNRILENDGKKRIRATWRIEAESGRRKELTKWASISAWGGNPSEFSADKEVQFIEGAIGNNVGNKEAAWLSATLLRSIGTYASEGYAVIPPGPDGKMKLKFLLPLGEGRYISGDDTGKFYANLFNLKEGLKGRASGLKDMIGRIPDMPMNLFDWAAVEVEGPEYPPNWDGTLQKRSVWDAWLGTAEQPLKNLLTGGIVEVKKFKTGNVEKWYEVRMVTDADGQTKEQYDELDADTSWRLEKGALKVGAVTGKDGNSLKDVNGVEKQFLIVPEEKGQRLGDLKFETLEREFHGTFTIMQWLMGSGEGPTGVFVDALKTSFRPEDFELNELKKKLKYIGIVMNPIILTKGSVHLYKDAGGSSGVIQNTFFDNLMNARKRSVSFAQNILGGVIKLLNPNDVEHPISASTAKLADMAIEEAKKNAGMESVADLVKHYIDENGYIRTKAGELDGKAIAEVINTTRFKDTNTGKILGKNTY